MTVELLYSITILLSLSLLYGIIVHYFYTKDTIRQVLAGLLFGSICVIGMMLPIELGPGVIIDPRSVVLSIAGLFGGPIGASIAGIIGASYRLYLGGPGMVSGVQLVFTSIGLGLAYRYCVQKGWAKLSISQLLLFGLAVHLVQVLLLTQLPSPFVEQVMANVAIPLVLIFTPTTALLGVILKNIDDRSATEQALIESESKLAHHLHNTPLAAISWDRDFNVTQWNKTAERIFGYTAEEAIGNNARDLILDTESQAAFDVEKVFQALWEQKGGTRSANDNITKDGRTINCEWYNTSILDKSGKLIGVASLCEDVTDRRKSEQMVWEQANYDLLTGLSNRKMINDRLDQQIKEADRFKTSLALLFLDLDKFKDINDTRGHDTGDKLLVEVATRLRSHTRSVDTIGRFGGDEFIIIIGGLESSDHVDIFANDLLKRMSEPYLIGQDTLYITTSIGITLYPQDASNSIEILRNADQAMYAAKNKGGNKFQYFEASMQKSALARMALIGDLRSAIANHQFQLHYQPIVNLENGNIHKAEALIRWQHPEKGLIRPVKFIPIAEETKLIVDIGDWVFREATRQSARWRKMFVPDFQISINTSPVQYKHEAFKTAHWLEHLTVLGLPGNAIAVEITEGVLMESERSVDQKLLDFRDANIQVALDDFGTGYSSLSALKRLDIDYLKIDKSFVVNLQPNSNDLALCEAMIVMAHKLKLKVIAEGIETKQQKELLLAAQCDYGQGYYFSKPLPASDFESLLKTSGGHITDTMNDNC